jgi:hypothetical protein
MSVIAVVSIVASATVAIVVPVITARLERSRLHIQLSRGALDELRGVLDSAVLALAASELALREAELAIEGAQSDDATPKDRAAAASALTAVRESLRKVWEHRYRIAVRLGSEERLPGIYERAWNALSEELSVLESALGGGPSSDDANAWGEVVRSVATARDKYQAQERDCLNAAAELVGPRTSPRS